MAAKEEIVTRIARKAGFTKKATYEFMEAFSEVLMETLANGERFHIHKIFTMKPIDKEAVMKHNPKTMEPVEVPACVKIKTIIGTELNEAVSRKNSVGQEETYVDEE